jgi:hypothetical protein
MQKLSLRRGIAILDTMTPEVTVTILSESHKNGEPGEAC